MKRREGEESTVGEEERGRKDDSAERSRRLPFMHSALASHHEEE